MMGFSQDEVHATFWAHLKELRNTLMGALAIIIIGMAITYCFYQQVFTLLTQPFEQLQQGSLENPQLRRYALKRERVHNFGKEVIYYAVPKNATLVEPYLMSTEGRVPIAPGEYIDADIAQSEKLAIFSPLEGMSSLFKVSFWMGLVFTSPFWIFVLMRFCLPAIHRRWQGMLFGFTALSFVFIAGGVLFAFYLTIPLANRYLFAFNTELGSNLWSLAQYLNYTIVLCLANGLAFELCALLCLLVHLGIIGPDAMRAKRRHAIVACFVLGALLTPPDVLTQIMLAIPLCILYELIILYAAFRGSLSRLKLGLKKSAHI